CLPCFCRSRRRRPVAATRFRPTLERLEARCVPTVLVSEHVVHPFGGKVDQVGQSGKADDGLQPEGDVTLSPDDSTLYGRAFAGGTAGDGTIFQVNIDGKHYETLHNFTGTSSPTDGSMPRHNAMAISPDGSNLYGMTVAGGKDGLGVVFNYELTGANPDTF